MRFGPFCLDGPQGHLWRGDQPIALRPQFLALLRYLVVHPGRLVSKTDAPIAPRVERRHTGVRSTL